MANFDLVQETAIVIDGHGVYYILYLKNNYYILWYTE